MGYEARMREKADALRALIARRAAHEPVQYLLGSWPFLDFEVKVAPGVLIPRQDTETLVEAALIALQTANDTPAVLDLCAGSGCVGLAIASHSPDARVVLGELSEGALRICRQNIRRNGLSGQVVPLMMDVMEGPSLQLGEFDCIVSNPPYIDAKDMEGLEVSVKDFEPHMALYGGSDGLDFYRSITEKYRHNLKPGGYLCYEFGEDQGDDVCDILTANGFTIRRRVNDFNGTERAVIAQYCVEE